MSVRPLFLGVCVAAVAWVTPASACLEIVTDSARRQALQSADIVVTAKALTEAYVAVPGASTLRAGVATARVTDVRKGAATVGQVIAYRVVDGEGGPPSCPARRATRPGATYTLYLKQAPDWGPPLLLLPTD